MPFQTPDGRIGHTADERIADVIDREKNCVDVSKLPIGTKLEVKTQNSLYKLEKFEDHWMIEGSGRYYQNGPEKGLIFGSSWGGSMMWVERLSPGMCAVFDRCRTSFVETIKVIGDGFDYELREGEVPA